MKNRNKKLKPRAFGTPKTPKQLAQDRKDRLACERIDKHYGIVWNTQQWLAECDYEDAHPQLAASHKVVRIAPRKQHPGRGEGSRSSTASGDGNSDDGSDPDPDHARPLHQQHPLQLLDQSALAAILCVSRKTLQNKYSTAPHTLPPAIQIPGARGPRWTAQSVRDWLNNRPQHTAKPAPVAAKRPVGRPRIATTLAIFGKGGAA